MWRGAARLGVRTGHGRCCMRVPPHHNACHFFARDNRGSVKTLPQTMLFQPQREGEGLKGDRFVLEYSFLACYMHLLDSYDRTPEGDFHYTTFTT
ncbi:hypothetical protein E2C01_056942 [Portunus trituberculatus]|uniref:Uncharacterized protein n=1 Tax=Portunus trituberculatus TaxID=210409 RepID=A0A5B7GVH5_PORTR|nr:hypothetical protein [Portunus trituberculatus]